MVTVVKYKVPVLHSKGPQKGKIEYQERSGIATRLYVNGYQERFALQFEGEDAEPSKLVHVPSGMIVGELNDAAIGWMLAKGTAGGLPTNRQKAEFLIASLCETHGAAKIAAKIKSAVVINA